MDNNIGMVHQSGQGVKTGQFKKYLLRLAEAVFILVLVLSMYGVFIDFLQQLFPQGTPISNIVNKKILLGGLFSDDDKNIRLNIDGQDLAFASNSDIDAIVFGKYRKVKIKRASEITWKNARKGMGLQAQDAVQTFDRSSANIKMAGAGNIKLGENSLIIIRNNDEDILLQEKRSRILMVSGELQGTLSEITDNKSTQIKIAMASGATAILSDNKNDKTVFKIKVNKDKSSVVTVLEGSVLIEAQDKLVRINKNQLLTILKDELPGVPEFIPDAVFPVSPEDKSVFYYRNLPPEIHFKWNLQSQVDEYEFVLATDSEFRDIVTKQNIKRTFFKHGNLREGRYFWRVRTNDELKDTIFSEPREIRVVKDIKPPKTRVKMPPANFSKSSYSLTGKTEPGSSVFVNSKPVEVKENGSFKHNLLLKKGTNVVIVEAVDIAGNITYISEMININAQDYKK